MQEGEGLGTGRGEGRRKGYILKGAQRGRYGWRRGMGNGETEYKLGEGLWSVRYGVVPT